MVISIECFLKVDKNSANKIIVIKMFLDKIYWTDKCMTYKVFVSKTKLLFKKQFLFSQKRVKARIQNWWNRDRTIIRRKLRIFFFLKIGVTIAVLSASGNIPYWNERFIKYVKGCFKMSTWLFRILTGMLYGWRLLFWLRLFINFSISDSWTKLMKNESTILFPKYVLKDLYSFGILDARFEPVLRKKS